MFQIIVVGVMVLIGLTFAVEVILDAARRGPRPRDYGIAIVVMLLVAAAAFAAMRLPELKYFIGGGALALAGLVLVARFLRDDLRGTDRRFTDYVIAICVAALVMMGLFAALNEKAKPLVAADVSDQNSHPISVSITPMLKESPKKGNKTSALPNAWQRKAPPPPKMSQDPLPSTQAKQTPDDAHTAQKPLADAAPPPDQDASAAEVDAAAVVDEDDAGASADAGLAVAALDDASTQSDGDTPGTASGEGHGLKDGIISDYKNRVAGFIMSRFNVRGKVPFDTLKNLHATAVVQVSGRTVTGFSVNPSGNGTFDAEVNATLSSMQANGVLLPAPPSGYEDSALGSGFPVYFACSDEQRCK